MNPNDQNVQPTNTPDFVPGIGNAPQPAPEPAQEQPVEQPQEQPQAPTEQPQAAPQEAQPAQPAEQPTTQPSQPQANPAASFDYDAYLDSLIGKDAPKIEMPAIPTDEQLRDDKEALTKYFGDLVETAVQKSVAENNKQATIREAETRAWNDVFDKYPEMKESKGLRDTVHNIRIGAYQRGQALSPLQVADQLIGDLRGSYKKAVNDMNVQTTVRDSQPLGGGTQPPAAQPVNYGALQDGGQNAAVEELTKLINQGKI